MSSKSKTLLSWTHYRTVLCSETDEDIAKYSVLKGNEQLFASKYKLYLPTEDELRAEIENQKTIFELQRQNKKEIL